MKTNKKLLLTVALSFITLAGVAVLLYLSQRNSAVSTSPQGVPVETIKLAPATEEELAEADKNKQQIVKREADIKQSTDESTTDQRGTIVIVNADSTSLSAYVNGIFEEGGTCTATATKDSLIHTEKSVGFENVSYTQCAPIKWSTPLSPGKWDIQVSYDSITSNIKTNKTLEIK